MAATMTSCALVLLGVMAMVYSSLAAPQHQGFHISYTDDESEMWVTWVVPEVKKVSDPYCRFTTRHGGVSGDEVVTDILDPSVSSPWFRVPATVGTYEDGKCHHSSCVPWVGVVLTAKLTGLRPSVKVSYACGDGYYGEGQVFTFVSRPPVGNFAPFSLAAMGDIGSYAESQLVRDNILTHTTIEATVQVGDIAYANGNQTLWDTYGRVMEPMTSSTPQLMIPGNHDGEWRYGNDYNRADVGGGDSGVSYSTRYPGPGPKIVFDSEHTGPMSSTSYWWSVDHRHVHIVAVSTVHEFHPGSEQYRWLEEDLRKANENRLAVPWVVVATHYPLYCTIDDCFCNYTTGNTCGEGPEGHVLAVTANFIRIALEPLLLRYKVDLVLTGHEHAYERTTPVSLMQASTDEPGYYYNPTAPVHVMAGTGGSGPDTKWQQQSSYPWSVKRSDTASTDLTPWGWIEIRFDREDTLACVFHHMKVDGVDGEFEVYDEFVIIKDL